MRLTTLSLTLCALALLCACGIKPGKLDAPASTDKKAFPRTYPDPGTMK